MNVRCIYANKCEFTDCWHHRPHQERDVAEDGKGAFMCSDGRRLCGWQVKRISVVCTPVQGRYGRPLK